MSLATATARFNRLASAARAALWPVTLTSGATTGLTSAKSPTALRRVQNEQATGWTQQAHATFIIAADNAADFLPALGTQFTITASQVADEIGTTWRCFDLKRANPATAADHKCVCFRLD